MRLFFAAFPDLESRRCLWAQAQSLPLSPPVRMHPPEKYHVTLLFLGNVAAGETQAVRDVGRAQQICRMPLQFGHWEYWSGANAVVAAASHVPEPLLQLRAGLTADLRRLDMDFDEKPLRPHITVARKIAQAPVLPSLSEFRWTASAFSLVASVTAPTGSAYTVVDTWPLLDTASRR